MRSAPSSPEENARVLYLQLVETALDRRLEAMEDTIAAVRIHIAAQDIKAFNNSIPIARRAANRVLKPVKIIERFLSAAPEENDSLYQKVSGVQKEIERYINMLSTPDQNSSTLSMTEVQRRLQQRDTFEGISQEFHQVMEMFKQRVKDIIHSPKKAAPEQNSQEWREDTQQNVRPPNMIPGFAASDAKNPDSGEKTPKSTGARKQQTTIAKPEQNPKNLEAVSADTSKHQVTPAEAQRHATAHRRAQAAGIQYDPDQKQFVYTTENGSTYQFPRDDFAKKVQSVAALKKWKEQKDTEEREKPSHETLHTLAKNNGMTYDKEKKQIRYACKIDGKEKEFVYRIDPKTLRLTENKLVKWKQEKEKEFQAQLDQQSQQEQQQMKTIERRVNQEMKQIVLEYDSQKKEFVFLLNPMHTWSQTDENTQQMMTVETLLPQVQRKYKEHYKQESQNIVLRLQDTLPDGHTLIYSSKEKEYGLRFPSGDSQQLSAEIGSKYRTFEQVQAWVQQEIQKIASERRKQMQNTVIRPLRQKYHGQNVLELSTDSFSTLEYVCPLRQGESTSAVNKNNQLRSVAEIEQWLEPIMEIWLTEQAENIAQNNENTEYQEAERRFVLSTDNNRIHSRGEDNFHLHSATTLQRWAREQQQHVDAHRLAQDINGVQYDEQNQQFLQPLGGRRLTRDNPRTNQARTAEEVNRHFLGIAARMEQVFEDVGEDRPIRQQWWHIFTGFRNGVGRQVRNILQTIRRASGEEENAFQEGYQALSAVLMNNDLQPKFLQRLNQENIQGVDQGSNPVRFVPTTGILRGRSRNLDGAIIAMMRNYCAANPHIDHTQRSLAQVLRIMLQSAHDLCREEQVIIRSNIVQATQSAEPVLAFTEEQESGETIAKTFGEKGMELLEKTYPHIWLPPLLSSLGNRFWNSTKRFFTKKRSTAWDIKKKK